MVKIREETKLSRIKVKLRAEGRAKYAIANMNGKANNILHRIVACMDCSMKTPAGTSVRAQGSSMEQGAQSSDPRLLPGQTFQILADISISR